MTVRSAGILLFRRRPEGLRLLLVHPGGPFWARRDSGAWSIPKGEYAADEEPLPAALREFAEETGVRLDGKALPLGALTQPSRKVVTAFAIEGDLDTGAVVSNSVTMEWPPRSGRVATFPEVDRAGWFAPDEARDKLLKGQRPFIDRLLALLGTAPGRASG